MPPLRSLASGLLLLAALAAPWVLGARMPAAAPPAWLGVLAGTAFLLTFAGRLRRSAITPAPPPLPRAALISTLFLLGCLAVWSLQPEPAFATSFADQHWRFMTERNAAGLLQYPRGERLVLSAAALLVFLTAINLGRDLRFRRRLLDAVSLSGLAAVAFGLGQRWLGWSAPSWLLTSQGIDAFSGPFFHHDAAAACFVVIWPLLAFRCAPAEADVSTPQPPPPRPVAVIAMGLLAIPALPLWQAQSAYAIVGALAAAGIAWRWLARSSFRPPVGIPTAIAAIFSAVFLAQLGSVLSLRAHHPDGWISAAATRENAPARDAAVFARAALRGDRLVASDAPPRAVAWLAAWRMAADHPLLGRGPGAWVHEAVLYSEEPVMNTFFQHRQFAHHDLLQTAAEWGVAPALAWLVLWVGAFRRVSGGPPHPANIGLALALLGLALYSLLNFPLQVPALQLWSALALGLAWSFPAATPRPLPHPPRATETTPPPRNA